MKHLYEAEDGKVFLTGTDCKDYEIAACISPLVNDIEKYCPTTYCDDAGFNIIEPKDVEEYILANYDRISTYVNKSKKGTWVRYQGEI